MTHSAGELFEYDELTSPSLVERLFCCCQDNQILKRWKEQILGKADVSTVGCPGGTTPFSFTSSLVFCLNNQHSKFLGVSKEPEVKILSLLIQSPGRPNLELPIHDRVSANSRRNSLFALKEGSSYHTRFTFLVSNSAVPGLKYTYTVWKAGIRGNKLSFFAV